MADSKADPTVAHLVGKKGDWLVDCLAAMKADRLALKRDARKAAATVEHWAGTKVARLVDMMAARKVAQMAGN